MAERQAQICGNAIILEGGQILLPEPTVDLSYTECVGGRRAHKLTLKDLSGLSMQIQDETDLDKNTEEWNPNLTREDIQGF